MKKKYFLIRPFGSSDLDIIKAQIISQAQEFAKKRTIIICLFYWDDDGEITAKYLADQLVKQEIPYPEPKLTKLILRMTDDRIKDAIKDAEEKYAEDKAPVLCIFITDLAEKDIELKKYESID